MHDFHVSSSCFVVDVLDVGFRCTGHCVELYRKLVFLKRMGWEVNSFLVIVCNGCLSQV